MERKTSDNGGSILQQYLSRLGLPVALGNEIIHRHAPIDYPRHSVVFLQNSPADLLFWVESGLVKVCSPAADGSRFVVHLAGPGEVLGYASVNDDAGQAVQAFDAESFTRCSIVPITREHIRNVVCKLHPGEMVRILEELNAVWAGIFAEFARFLGLGFRERLHNVLDDLAARFGVADARGTLLTPELSHDDFAELIGSSRPMASRLISELIDEAIILRDGKRYILRNSSKTGAAAQKISSGAAWPSRRSQN